MGLFITFLNLDKAMVAPTLLDGSTEFERWTIGNYYGLPLSFIGKSTVDASTSRLEFRKRWVRTHNQKRYFQSFILLVVGVLSSVLTQIQPVGKLRLNFPLLDNFSSVYWLYSTGNSAGIRWNIRKSMANFEVKELVVHLERSLDLSNIDSGIKLVGASLVNKTLTKWGIQNILRSAWKDLSVVDIKWVRDNLFIVTVLDENTAAIILVRVKISL